MPQYLAPGVYVEEVPSGSAPIAGVGTSISGFAGVVGEAVTMPPQPGGEEEGYYPLVDPNSPQLVTSWDGFRSRFGEIGEANRLLAHAVYGFFLNGGTRCWVTRVADVEGADGREPPSATALREALATFEPVDEIALVAAPGAVGDAAWEVVAHCEQMGDRFALLDAANEADVGNLDGLRGEAGNTDYAAMYFPWITVLDPAAGKRIDVPLSGHVAGVYARVDAQRGVHKAPANEVIRGALDVSTRLSRADQAGLNPTGINAIRLFDNNVTVWGARTLGGDANGEWKYVSIRRLFLYIRESIEEGTRWVVFEPNGPQLWAKIRRNVAAFLTNVWRDGALFGTTPEQAFYVRCDETNNPPEVREQGLVIVEVGIAVVQPAEFVVFRLSQWVQSA